MLLPHSSDVLVILMGLKGIDCLVYLNDMFFGYYERTRGKGMLF